MLFNSVAFLVFFPLVVAIYFICPHRYRWAWLLIASYYFYAAWAPEYVVWIAGSTLFGYVLAIQIAKTSVQARRRALLALGLLANLGLLFALKYLNFFNDSLRALLDQFNIFYNVPTYQALLPVGISFYTFQILSYVIDVYRGKIEPERHLGFFALFLSFFPQLVAGPIERAGRMLPQFRANHEFSASRVSGGLRLMLWGMFKKVVIADRLAIYVNAVYNNPGDYHGFPVILATYFFAIQIYCDFSGYSDIAVGAAQVMGYDLVANFRQPYCSSSIASFWTRWHTSLYAWFRDYLYIPLGGSRVPRLRWYANLMTVFLVSGLWHGATWTFVLWGALHGSYLVLETCTERLRGKVFRVIHLAEKSAVRTIVSTFVTFNLVCFAWIFFRANSVSEAFLLVSNLTRTSAPIHINAPWAGIVDSPGLEMAFSLGLVALVAVTHFYRDRKLQMLSVIERGHWVRWVACLLLALAIMNLGISQETPFIYLQF